jgi:Leucine-rich repeat (LRR) protein
MSTNHPPTYPMSRTTNTIIHSPPPLTRFRRAVLRGVQIWTVQPGILDGLHVVRMARNPTICQVDAQAAVKCACPVGLTGDGTFCVEQYQVEHVCGVTDTDPLPGDSDAVVSVTVDCVGKGLVVLPRAIPYRATVLDLRDNRLVYLDAASLAVLTSLLELRLDGNRIVAIEQGLMSTLPRLQTLTMHGNPSSCAIESAVPVCVCADGHSSRGAACVKQPLARRVCIASEPTRQLTTPQTSGGRSTADGVVRPPAAAADDETAGPTTTTASPRTRSHPVADCSSRALEVVPAQMSPDVGTVYLSYNTIDHVAASDFDGHPKLVELYINHNALTSIAHDAFVGTPNLRLLDLSYNSNLMRISPQSFRGPLETGVLRSILFDYNPSVCRVARGVLADCKCAAPTHDGVDSCDPRPDAAQICDVTESKAAAGVSVDCSARKISLFPIAAPLGTARLSLEHNRITTLRAFYFEGLEHVEVLSLAMNPLTHIPDGVFAALGRLRVLDLQQHSRTMEGSVLAGPLALTELPHTAQVFLTPPSDGDVEAEETASGRTCVRALARDATAAVHAKIVPLLNPAGRLTTGLNCPLNLFQGQFSVHEALKYRRGANRHTCQECGKAFRTEEWLDVHLNHRHGSMVPVHATVCPHRFCDVLGCDCSTQCDSRRLAKLVPKCNALMRQCAPNDETYQHLSSVYCGNLTCDGLTELCEESTFGVWFAVSLIIVLLIMLLACSNRAFFQEL